MRNWPSIEGLERGTRNSFLINKKPTETEIYRMSSFFEQIQGATARIETLIRGLKFRPPKSEVGYQIEEQTTRLFLIYESLKEMLRDNEALQFRFELNVAKIRKRTNQFLGTI